MNNIWRRKTEARGRESSHRMLRMGTSLLQVDVYMILAFETY